MPSISKSITLEKSLHYLHVSELKTLCNQLQLSVKGKKSELIHRITYFIETGKKLINIPFPKISCAKKNGSYVLSKESLMLKNAYKNDHKTRIFFKNLIGEYFHFTAFGIDWLEMRWRSSNPPTYQEFADMWTKEYQERKINPANPKQEWAYINFVQGYYLNKPNAPREEVLNAWENERIKHKYYVKIILNEVNK